MAGMRISRDEMLMEIAQVVAKRGTCSRLQVGAVISRDGRIIATGYNGAPSGIEHCDHSQEAAPRVMLPDQPLNDFDLRLSPGRIMELPRDSQFNFVDPGCQIAEHAERNAIAFAARYGLALEGSEMHCTDAPCLNCARSIINAGITAVSFARSYRITDGVDLLRRAKIQIFDYSHTS